MPATITIEDLTRILSKCAGQDEAVNLSGNIMDTSLGELGYDSLALLETASQIEREYGVSLPDDVVGECETPGDMLAAVNKRLATA
jgi:act minimal PKS acyl carrier protein